MLKLAAKHYLKSVGDKFFVPNPDYIEWSDVSCLDIIIKRQPRWFRFKTKYVYSHFRLNDILDTPIELDETKYMLKPESLTPDFCWSSNHKINGSFGAKIVSLASLDLKGDDVVNVSIQFQDMVKYSVNFSEVQKMLSSKKVNLSGQFVKNLAQDQYNVICLVTQYIAITKDTEIKISCNRDVEGDIGVTKLQTHISDEEEYKNEKSKTIKFAAGTRLAFDITECLIKSDGSIILLDRSESRSKWGMIPKVENDVPSAQLPNYCAHIVMNENQNFDMPDTGLDKQDDLSPIFEKLSSVLMNKSRSVIVTHLLNLKINHSIIFHKLELLILFCEQEHNLTTINLISLNQFTKEMLKNEDLNYLLMILGVNKENEIKISEMDKTFLSAFSVLMETMDQLEVELLDYIYQFIHTVHKSDNSVYLNLIIFLQNIKFIHYFDLSKFELLITKRLVKLILLSLGITKNNCEFTNALEPSLILLQML